MSLLDSFLLAFIGLAGGVAVGSGFVAFLTVLDIVPRLTAMTRTRKRVPWYETALVMGALLFTLADFRGWIFSLLPVATGFIGLLCGIFVGFLTGALTEVVNVLPILAKRIRMESRIFWLLMAMVLGKVAGSLFQWLIF